MVVLKCQVPGIYPNPLPGTRTTPVFFKTSKQNNSSGSIFFYFANYRNLFEKTIFAKAYIDPSTGVHVTLSMACNLY